MSSPPINEHYFKNYTANCIHSESKMKEENIPIVIV